MTPNAAGGPARSVTFKLPTPLADELERLTTETGLPRSELLRQGVELLTDPVHLAAVVALRLADVEPVTT